MNKKTVTIKRMGNLISSTEPIMNVCIQGAGGVSWGLFELVESFVGRSARKIRVDDAVRTHRPSGRQRSATTATQRCSHGLPQTAVAHDFFSITAPYGGSIKAITFIWPSQPRTSRGVYFVHPLDERGPGLTTATGLRNRCGIATHRRLCRRSYLGNLLSLAVDLIRVPSVITDRIRLPEMTAKEGVAR